MNLPVSHARAPMNARRACSVWVVLALTGLVVFVAALALGSVTISPWQVLLALVHASSHVADGGPAGDLAGEIVRGLRLPPGPAVTTAGASPLATVSKPTHHLIGEVHEKIGWAK